MSRRWKMVFIAPLAILAMLVFAYIGGELVMRLWNWLMPPLFGWRLITFWQALGILILCKILFGGFRGRPGPRVHWRRRMFERWERMSPEEREKFRQGMRSRCGSFGSAAGSTAAEPKA